MIVLKDPDAKLDYKVDWRIEPPEGPWLNDGEILVDSAWIVPAGITEESRAFSDHVAIIWLSGGTPGRSYVVTNRIRTNSDRRDDRSITIRVTHR